MSEHRGSEHRVVEPLHGCAGIGTGIGVSDARTTVPYNGFAIIWTGAGCSVPGYSIAGYSVAGCSDSGHRRVVINL